MLVVKNFSSLVSHRRLNVIEFLMSPWGWLLLFLVSMIAGVAWGLKKGKERKGENSMKVNAGVVAVVLAVLAVVLFQLPSLSIDINGIFTYAFDVVNAFMPLIAIIAGLGLGFNLITKISSLFNRAL